VGALPLLLTNKNKYNKIKFMLKEFSGYIVYSLLGLKYGDKISSALEFFIYDTIKIFLLLSAIIFVISIVRSYFPPERARKILSHRRRFIGHILAALLGVVTPFCSCSAVPLFIGFIEAGVPLGVTFSFLISSPMVNEIALVLLYGLFGLKAVAVYVGAGLFVALVVGLLIGRLRAERWVEDYVFKLHMGSQEEGSLSFRDRLTYAKGYTFDILKRVSLYIVIAIAIGGFIHGYAPEGFLERYAGKGNFFAVPLAVVIGVPLYSNAAGIMPIASALYEKGLGIGTVLAFMMSVTALSLPEMIILRKVLKPQLLAVFVGIMTIAIILVGYMFNAIL